ncbi:hypothetical protein PHLCEN_2v10775 [Hermanssonia centrifuga]|uniref:Uncharacterized protein n=1 Tax=Hermanssonia centrifuga TaxID=98765 RepID=A0A2R6NM77_9APHY|nr:hypothetical protein PHLCEN_2v10775 [Hermanssonia centrifuga]
MSRHLRTSSATETDALYRPLPQSEAVSEATSSPLELEGDEELVAEEFVAQERLASHDRRIGWIHFILGSAILLPWNALITATPYFLSRVEGSPLKSTFSSYLSTTFTFANFAFLAHATATTDQSTNSRRILLSISWLTLLMFLLTLSTYIHSSPGVFFAFVLVNGICQAAAGSYLQTAVIAVASFFGPTAIQPIMSGQAAIGVAVSGIEVLSAASSLRNSAPAEARVDPEPEEKSAFIFFGLSTLFLLISAGAQIWLTKLPLYKALKDRFRQATEHTRSLSPGDFDEGYTPPVDSRDHILHEEKKHQLVRIAKTNVIYNIAVAYVFIVTLVGSFYLTA